MEKYYIPQNVGIQNSGEFFVTWNGENYRIYPTCPNRTITKNYDYTEINPFGYTVDTGSDLIALNKDLITGYSCASDVNTITQVYDSQSIFDVPNYTPYEPLYFLGFFALTIFLFLTAVKMVFGRKLL